jgi:hypothetical protein
MGNRKAPTPPPPEPGPGVPTKPGEPPPQYRPAPPPAPPRKEMSAADRERIEAIRELLIDTGCDGDDGLCSEIAESVADYCLPCQTGWLFLQLSALSEALSVAQQKLAKKPEFIPPPFDKQELTRRVAGAIKSTLDHHGPITLENRSSVTKRITGELYAAKAATESKLAEALTACQQGRDAARLVCRYGHVHVTPEGAAGCEGGTLVRMESAWTAGRAQGEAREDRSAWLTRHVDLGHSITRREDYDECSCGGTFWRAALSSTPTEPKKETDVDQSLDELDTYALKQEIRRLRRYIATFPARPWLETDHPDVVACMGSAPACARNGCQLGFFLKGIADATKSMEGVRKILAEFQERNEQKKKISR